MLIETEKGIFSHNSFFLRKERGLSVLPSFCEQTGIVVDKEAKRSEGNDNEIDLTEDVVQIIEVPDELRGILLAFL